MHNELVDYWQELLFVMQTMPLDTIVKAAEMLLDCYQRGSTIFTLGNGGSAATASHFACDLAKGTKAFPAFRVISLGDNVSLLTAWANDTSYDRVFAEQLASLVRPDDVVVAISVSGNSPNVLAAASVAQRSGAITIALTDQSGGKLSQLADLAICVPSQAIEQVENAHLIIAHSLCALLRQRLYAPSQLIEEVEPSVTSAFP
ncbi:MAG: SIS domain-containing protein [Chloroflexi bacterium]|nr:SIS domain-containing protein [Chloroflexota bacterium]